ncbi:hypothetical protein [Ideonella azotifigens]|nr:hypothetical protein [Ideonella azotifigens]
MSHWTLQPASPPQRPVSGDWPMAPAPRSPVSPVPTKPQGAAK